jgi:hypothetical protein
MRRLVDALEASQRGIFGERDLRHASRFASEITRLLRMASAMTAVKTCGTTNKEKHRPGNRWATAVG